MMYSERHPVHQGRRPGRPRTSHGLSKSQLHRLQPHSLDPGMAPPDEIRPGANPHGIRAARRQFLTRSHTGERLSARFLQGSTLGCDFAQLFLEHSDDLSFMPDPSQNPRTPLDPRRRLGGDDAERCGTPLSKLRISMSEPAPLLSRASPLCRGAFAGEPALAGPSSSAALPRPPSLLPVAPTTGAGGAPRGPAAHHAGPSALAEKPVHRCSLASDQWHSFPPSRLTAAARAALLDMRCADGSPLWGGLEEAEVLAALEVGQLRCYPRCASRRGARTPSGEPTWLRVLCCSPPVPPPGSGQTRR